MRIALLLLEFLAIFVVVPVLLYYRVLPNRPIPLLLVAAFGAYLALRHQPGFSLAQTMSIASARGYVGPMLIRDAICVLALGIAVRLLAPELLFSLIKRSPGLWLLIMVLYPVVSVFPQELLYRAFFFQRYAPLWGRGWTMILASALVFGFAHILFGNWISVGLCIIGGLLFAWTYQQSNSLLLTCLEHAIFGNFIFTIGIGQYFYHGTRR